MKTIAIVNPAGWPLWPSWHSLIAAGVHLGFCRSKGASVAS